MSEDAGPDRHRVLQRQLRSLALACETTPTVAAWRQFLDRVDTSYRDADADRYLLERSLEVSSAEMADLYEALRRHSESELAVQHARLSALTEHFPLGILECAPDGEVLFENPAWLTMCGRSLVETGESLYSVIDEGDAANLIAAAHEAAKAELSPSVTVRLTGTTGACTWARIRIRALLADEHDADSRRWFVSAADVTDEVEARAASERLTVLLEAATDMVALFEPNGRLLHLNRVGRELLSSDGANDQRAPSLADLFDDASGQRVLHEALPILTEGGIWRGEAVVKGPDREVPVSLVLVPHLGRDGRTEYCSAIARDVTELKAAQDALVREATHDALTGLPNRPLLLDRLDHAVRRAQRAHSVLAVLYVDLDRFKRVNDSLGHDLGDLLIVRAAERLTTCVRSVDTVARLGGDEFVVVAEDVDGPDAAIALARWIVSSFTDSFDLDGSEAFVTASVGVALLSGPADTATTLLRDADVAMYRAKERGRGRYEVYDAAMHASVTKRFELEASLRRAIDDHELGVHYQPQINLASGAVVGFEALARWLRPVDGDVPAAVFISLAEETGLIARIGEGVLAQACFDAKRWNIGRGDRAPMTISVNVSPRQLTQPGLLASVDRVLGECGLSPSLLTLEITESVLVDDPEVAQLRLEALRDLGVRVAIDDFGKGYSSLAYLARFPLDQIKIDQVFIAALDSSASNHTIVSSMIQLAHTLDLEVVAEGVERTSQLEMLRELGCDVIQGYVVSPAVPPPAAAMWVEQGSWRPPRDRSGMTRLSAPMPER